MPPSHRSVVRIGARFVALALALPTREAAAESPSAQVALRVGWHGTPTSSEVHGGFVVGVPWDESFSHASAPRGDATKAKASPSPPPSSLATPLPSPRAQAHTPEERSITAAIAISGSEARAAIREAHRSAGVDGEASAIDRLAERARRSALLPQLRLRAMRVATESAASVPTSYDPLRTTLSGGTSLWLEARATWDLDRLLFAPEELRLARLARDLRAERERLERRLLDALYGWQSAAAQRLDPSASFHECRAAYVKELQLGAELDRMTDGWFRTFLARRAPLPEPDCSAIAERVER